jgi:hypothetical protein
MSEEQKYSFAIIHHRGSPTKATTLDGHKVERLEEIFIPEWGAFIKCAPYLEHFIYEDPESKIRIGRWVHMCTCGSPAVIVGFDAYKRDASKGTGSFLVCKLHADTGLHNTGGVVWQ